MELRPRDKTFGCISFQAFNYDALSDGEYFPSDISVSTSAESKYSRAENPLRLLGVSKKIRKNKPLPLAQRQNILAKGNSVRKPRFQTEKHDINSQKIESRRKVRNKKRINPRMIDLSDPNNSQVYTSFKIYLEDELSFLQHPVMDVRMSESTCDNDLPTDDEQIIDSVEFLQGEIREAIHDFAVDASCVSNYEKYELSRGKNKRKSRVY